MRIIIIVLVMSRLMILKRAGALIVLSGVVMSGAALVGCANSRESVSSSDSATESRIVVTTALLGSIVSEAVGSSAQVQVLMPATVEPHEWQPSARDREALESADVVVVNGGGLESGLDDTIREIRSSGVFVFDAAEQVSAISGDPHFWTDPQLVATMVVKLEESLHKIGIDLAHGDEVYEAIVSVDHFIEMNLSEIPSERRLLVTGHESLQYFAKRYGFTVVGTVIPGQSSMGDVSAQDIARLEDSIEGKSISAIFVEAGVSRSVVDALSQDLGVKVVEIDPERLTTDQTYVEFISALAGSIHDGLVDG